MSLIITHNAGFFSCCSVKLDAIVNYINRHRKLPEKIDSSKQFKLYKPNPAVDITYDFFEIPNSSEYIFTNSIKYNYTYEYRKYSDLNFENIVPIVKKYFEPSQQIKTLADKFINKYNICYENCIAIYYRGTDKRKLEKGKDTQKSFESYHNKLNELLTIVNNDNVQILIQTDSAQFLNYITTQNKNKQFIILEELVPSNTCKGPHRERTKQQNYCDITNLLSIVSIISKCKYIICSTGNVSMWITLYRGNCENVYQNSHCNWV